MEYCYLSSWAKAVKLKLLPHLCHVFDHVSRNRKKKNSHVTSKLFFTCNMEGIINKVSWPFCHNIFSLSLKDNSQKISLFLKLTFSIFASFMKKNQINYGQKQIWCVILPKYPKCHVTSYFFKPVFISRQIHRLLNIPVLDFFTLCKKYLEIFFLFVMVPVFHFNFLNMQLF